MPTGQGRLCRLSICWAGDDGSAFWKALSGQVIQDDTEPKIRRPIAALTARSVGTPTAAAVFGSSGSGSGGSKDERLWVV